MRLKQRFLAIIVVLGTFVVIMNIFKLKPFASSDVAITNEQSYFVCALFHNNEEVLHSFRSNLLKLTEALGKERVYVSILENGSKDRTKDLLVALKEDLDERRIPNRIILEDTPKSYVRRIPYLAALRNRVMEPLYEDGKNYDRVIFFNDVFWEVGDLLDMIQSFGDHYDAFCGLDFDFTFYDTFATREYSATEDSPAFPPSTFNPYFFGRDNQYKVRRGEHVPVFSCWNGLVILNAKPFVERGVRFRALFPDRDSLSYEASECCLVFADMYAKGFTRVFIDPRKHFFYHRYTLQLLAAYGFSEYIYSWFHIPTPPLRGSEERKKYERVYKQARDAGVSKLDATCVQP